MPMLSYFDYPKQTRLETAELDGLCEQLVKPHGVLVRKSRAFWYLRIYSSIYSTCSSHLFIRLRRPSIFGSQPNLCVTTTLMKTQCPWRMESKPVLIRYMAYTFEYKNDHAHTHTRTNLTIRDVSMVKQHGINGLWISNALGIQTSWIFKSL